MKFNPNRNIPLKQIDEEWIDGFITAYINEDVNLNRCEYCMGNVKTSITTCGNCNASKVYNFLKVCNAQGLTEENPNYEALREKYRGATYTEIRDVIVDLYYQMILPKSKPFTDEELNKLLS